jgi:hypothetical protein
MNAGNLRVVSVSGRREGQTQGWLEQLNERHAALQAQGQAPCLCRHQPGAGRPCLPHRTNT